MKILSQIIICQNRKLVKLYENIHDRLCSIEISEAELEKLKEEEIRREGLECPSYVPPYKAPDEILTTSERQRDNERNYYQARKTYYKHRLLTEKDQKKREKIYRKLGMNNHDAFLYSQLDIR